VAESLRNYGYAMPLSLLATLGQLARSRRPAVVLEVGAGLSTIVLQRALAESGGELVSVEDDPAHVTHERVAGVVLRPVTPDTLDAIRSAFAGRRRANLLVIDGPAGRPRFEDERLELYLELADESAAWVIDDTDRADNADAARLISQRLGLRIEQHDDPLSRGHRYTLLLP
jgi:hypothetical protein